MAGTLKNWVEAAGLMLVHCRKRVQNIVCPSVFSPGPHMLTKPADRKPDKNKNPLEGFRNWEVELLMMKKTHLFSNVKDSFCFPAGVPEDIDFSKQWLKLYGATNEEKFYNRFDFVQKKAKSAPLYHRKRSGAYSHLPPEVAFRITAIREMFKLTGVLLCRSADINNFQLAAMPSHSYYFGPNHVDQVEEWLSEIRARPDKFFLMCQKLDLVPDIWSLYDWSNWLNPSDSLITETRYDQINYVCCLQRPPYYVSDRIDKDYIRKNAENMHQRPVQSPLVSMLLSSILF